VCLCVCVYVCSCVVVCLCVFVCVFVFVSSNVDHKETRVGVVVSALNVQVPKWTRGSGSNLEQVLLRYIPFGSVN